MTRLFVYHGKSRLGGCPSYLEETLTLVTPPSHLVFLRGSLTLDYLFFELILPLLRFCFPRELAAMTPVRDSVTVDASKGGGDFVRERESRNGTWIILKDSASEVGSFFLHVCVCVCV